MAHPPKIAAARGVQIPKLMDEAARRRVTAEKRPIGQQWAGGGFWNQVRPGDMKRKWHNSHSTN
jgi:hypothetical protein